MFFDGAFDLHLPKVIAQAALFLADVQRPAIGERDVFAAGRRVHIIHDKSVPVNFPLAGQHEQIFLPFDFESFLLHAVAGVDMDFQLGEWSLPGGFVVNRLHLHIGVVESVLAGDAGDNDLFHQPQFVGADRVKFIDQIIRVLVRGRITQRAKRIQRPDGFLRLLGVVHALRLVNDDDGMRGLHEFNRLPA